MKIVIPLVLSLLVGAAVGAEEAKVSPVTLEKENVKGQVKVLREKRFHQMPYLDRDYVRKTLSEKKVRAQIAFGSEGIKNLSEIIDYALRIHTPARAAHERIALARRRIIAALRGLFPEANFEMNEREGVLSDDQYNSFNYRFSFKQPLFRGGILWNTLLQEKAGLEAAEKEYDAALSDLISELAAAYFEFNRASQILKDQQESVEKVKRFSDLSRQKLEAEIISEIENLNTQSLVSQMEYDLETSKQEFELAQLELSKFLDLMGHTTFSVESPYALKDLIAKSEVEEEAGSYDFEGEIKLPALVELVDLAYQNRPELRVEAAKLQSARLEERVKWGAMLPQADITLEFGKLGEAFDVFSMDPGLRTEFRLALEMNWNAAGNKVGYTFENDERAPSVTQFLSGSGSQVTRNTLKAGLLDGLGDWVSAKEAEVERLDQVIELEKAEKEAVHDVKQAYFDFEKSRIQVKSSVQRVGYRKRLLELQVHKLEKNEIQISEYVQAELDLTQEIASLHKALAEYYTAKAKLNHSVGIRNFLKIETLVDGK
ncbi:MAG: TolC family protein [Candidatus Omnitrophica bacterium]|nr:TolC family protein [Candidatus Omnitrophota bacterium]